MGGPRPWRIRRLLFPVGTTAVFTFPCCFLLVLCLMGSPVQVFAQGAERVEGLGHGARDSSRLDLRLGDEERAASGRIADQRIGKEQSRIRWERKQKDLLRSQEQASLKTTRQKQEDEDSRAAREREDARIHHQKKKFRTRY